MYLLRVPLACGHCHGSMQGGRGRPCAGVLAAMYCDLEVERQFRRLKQVYLEASAAQRSAPRTHTVCHKLGRPGSIGSGGGWTKGGWENSPPGAAIR